MKKLNLEEVKKRCDKFGFKIISDYKNVSTKVEFKCKKCGKIFTKRPMDLFQFPYCPCCNPPKSMKHGSEKIKDDIQKILGDEYSVLSTDIKNTRSIVNVCHKKCGETFAVKVQYLKNFWKCPTCYAKHRHLTYDMIKDEIKTVGNDEYELISSTYKNTKTPMTFYHKKCGKTFKMKYESFHAGQRCPYCALEKKIERCHKTKKSQKTFENEVSEITSNEYSVCSEYINSRTDILLKHEKCGNTFYVKPHDFLSKTKRKRCPICESSTGEIKIAEYLTKKGIIFERQVRIPNTTKAVDFAVFNKKHELQFMLEYDGYFHWHAFNQEEKSLRHFENQKKSDKYKEDYCTKHSISLYRIPYWYYGNIESIIDILLTSSKNNITIMTSDIDEFSDVKYV